MLSVFICGQYLFLLIGAGFLRVVDDDDFDRALGRLEFESKLVLDGAEDRRVIGSRCARAAVAALSRPESLALVRRPFQGEIITSPDPGPVENHVIEPAGQVFG